MTDDAANSKRSGVNPDLLKLPIGATSSGDPIIGNPFSPGTARHGTWQSATRKAKKASARSRSKYQTKISSLKQMPPLRRDRDVPELEREMRLAQFDIWAERNIQVLGSDADVRANDEFLVSYAESFLEAAANWFHAMPQAAKEEQLRLLGE